MGSVVCSTYLFARRLHPFGESSLVWMYTILPSFCSFCSPFLTVFLVRCILITVFSYSFDSSFAPSTGDDYASIMCKNISIMFTRSCLSRFVLFSTAPRFPSHTSVQTGQFLYSQFGIFFLPLLVRSLLSILSPTNLSVAIQTDSRVYLPTFVSNFVSPLVYVCSLSMSEKNSILTRFPQAFYSVGFPCPLHWCHNRFRLMQLY